MAQFVNPSIAQLYDASGNPYAGGKCYIYQTGTTTPLSLFSNEALSVAASNPLVADSAGIFPTVYIAQTKFKAVFTTSADVTIKTVDPVYSIGLSDNIDGGDVIFDGSGIGYSSDNVQDAIEEAAGEISGRIAASTMTTRGDMLVRNATVPARLPLGTSGQVLKSDGTDPAWSSTGPYPPGYLNGLALTNATDTDHDISIAAGYCRDSTNVDNLDLASALVKRIDASWTVGTAGGGLDTGSVGNSTWYYVWLIKRSDTGVVDALFSASSTSPTMPASYDRKRRIGAVRTDSSANILQFRQFGDEFHFVNSILDIDTTSLSTTATAFTVTCPPNMIFFGNAYASISGGTASGVLVRTTFNEDIAVSSSTAGIANVPHTGTTQIRIPVSASSQVTARAADTATLRVATRGYVDTRDR